MKRSLTLSLLVALAVLCLLAAAIWSSWVSAAAQDDGDPPPAAVAPAAVSAFAGHVFSYQGQLTNAAGNPITNAALPMTFRLFTTLTGGTACWSENQTVNVQSGQFNVLLGSVMVIPTSCLSGISYLELVVNGETLNPRELIASVPYAIQANTLPANATTLGPLTTGGDLTVNGVLMVDSGDSGRIVAPPGSYSLQLENPTGRSTRMTSGGNLMFFLDADDNETGTVFKVYKNSDHLGGNVAEVATLTEEGTLLTAGEVHAAGNSVCNGRGTCLSGTDIRVDNQYALHVQQEAHILHLLPFANPTYDQVCIGCGATGRGLVVRGGLEVHGGCTQVGNREDGTYVDDADCEPGSITSGAYVEANLMTNEERAAETVERFEQGDLLCWSAAAQQLERCATANDRLVMAVASADGKPIVLGAEPVKVIGPIVAGDLLVSSGVPGHAMADNDPLPGTVIGQALEDLDQESGMVKAMVRKW